MSTAPRHPLFVVLALVVLVLPAVSAAQVRLLDAEPLPLGLPDVGLPLPGEPSPPVAGARGDAASWLIPGRLVVGFEDDATLFTPALSALAAAMGGRVVRVDTLLDFAVVAVPEGETERLAKEAGRLPGVKYAQQDMRMQGFFTPDDPRYADQWGAPAMSMPAAWDQTLGSHDRTVAILDTGVWSGHPDLAANVCVEGPDYPNADADPEDDNGHGTHVAGTVAAVINNSEGVAGMANACLMSVKVLDAWGSGSFADLASALAWAADNGAHVASMSLGGCPGCDPGNPTRDAVEYAAQAGVLLVAAAGNDDCSPVSYPAAYPEVVAVAALAPPGDQRAGFSNCGAEVEVSAPGVNVVSTTILSGDLGHPSGYLNLSGTSMATPHVSGVAALVWSANANLTAQDLRCILSQTAVDLGAPGHDAGTGHGRVDAAAALAQDECVPTAPSAPVLTGAIGYATAGSPSNDSAHATRLLGAESFALPMDADDHEGDAGLTLDRSPAGRHATLGGVVPVAGRHGDAYLFDGAGQYVDIPHTGEMPEGTVMFWVRNDDPAHARAFFKQAPGVWNDLAIHVDTRVHFNTQQDSESIETAPGSVTTGQWTHVAVTWGPAGKRIYLDGGLAASNNDTTGVSGTSWNTMLGNSPNDLSTGGFRGAFDEVRQYDAALDAGAIQTLMTHPYADGDPAPHAVLSWTVPASLGSDLAAYRVYQATDGGPLSQAAELPPGTTSATLGPLSEGTTYSFAVSGVNEAGEGNLSNVVDLTPLAPLPLPYETDFESNSTGWTATGLWHVTTDRSQSGIRSWYYGNENGPGLDDNDYDVGTTRGELVSPPFSLDGVGDAMLSFWTRWEGEGGSWEQPIVQVSTGGTTGPWTTVYSNASASGEGVILVSLADYEGSVVHLRFLWDTKDSIANDYEGWYVDDVRLASGVPPPPPETCGMDAYGNECRPIAYAFEDVSATGTPLPLGDDVTDTLALPFPFTFYGQTYGNVTVSSNGYLDFGHVGTSGCCQGSVIPSDSEPDAFIAAAWTDLNPSAGGSVVHATLGEPGARTFVVQFTGVPFFHSTGSNTFQIKLLEATGAAEVHYQQLGDGNSPVTAGIEDCDGADGIQLRHGDFSFTEAAFRYSPGNGTPDACVAPTPVTIDILSPSAGATVNGTVTVSGVTNASGASPVHTYVFVDEDLVYYVPGSGPWNFSYDTTALLDGAHVLWVEAYDDDSSGYRSIWFTSENQPHPNGLPVATIASPQNDETLPGAFNVTGTAHDPDGDAIQQVRVRIDGVERIALGAENWTLPANGTLADGWHSIAASAYDGADWGPEHAIWIRVDNTPPYHAPTVAILEPQDGATVSGIVDVTGVARAHPWYGVALVQVRVDGGAWTDAVGWTNWTYALDTRALVNGTHLVEARSFDGATFSAIAAVTVSVENEGGPFVSITSPTTGSYAAGIILVQGIAQPGATVEVRIDGGAWLPTLGASRWSRYVDTRALAEGLHDLEARSSDGETHSRVALVQFFTWNQPPPSVHIDTPLADETVRGFATVTGRALGSAERPVQRVEVSLDGWSWSLAQGTDAWSARLDVRSAWSPGYHAILARAWDGMTHSYAYVYVHVDNRADLTVPSLEILRSPLQTEAGDAPNLANEERTIRFVVRNEGATASAPTEATVSFQTTTRIGTARQSHESTTWVGVPSLAPGASAVLEVPWDTTKYLGDVDVVVQADAFRDVQEADERNNQAKARTYVRLGGWGGWNADQLPP